MPDNNQTNTTNPLPPVPAVAGAPAVAAPASATGGAPTPAPVPVPAPAVAPADVAPVNDKADDKADEAKSKEERTQLLTEVAAKISEAHNILVALSSDPSVDDLAAAIGLSLYLDRLGKRATAIYSGTTPNALEFLKPEETLEATTDTLQDFVIALDKDKADHLRYKLDGDYVKIYITPYKARISEEDLEFSYGDFNVDLVLALDVASGADLDSALREHGRIMHDATVINITTANPGKFGDIEWSDPHSSSVSEMVADLLYNVNSKIEINAEEATAFLTGVIAATDRFSAPNTTPATLQIAAQLMASGADQQLIAQNISEDDKLFTFTNNGVRVGRGEDATSLAVEHGNDEDEGGETEAPEMSAPAMPAPSLPTVPVAEAPVASATEAESFVAPKPEKVVAPSPEFTADVASEENADKYSQMLTDALAEVAPAVPTVQNPDLAAPGLPDLNATPTPVVAPTPAVNPAASIAPPVAVNPEINGVPAINYAPLPGDQVLPPPPAPPIDMNSPMPNM